MVEGRTSDDSRPKTRLASDLRSLEALSRYATRTSTSRSRGGKGASDLEEDAAGCDKMLAQEIMSWMHHAK
jgi:hypothetical protein